MGCDNTLRARCLRLFSHSAGLATTAEGGLSQSLTLLVTKKPCKREDTRQDKKKNRGKKTSPRQGTNRES